MDVEWFRDFIIGIAGVVLIVVLIFLSVITYSVYRRLRNTLDSIEATSATIHEFTVCIRDEVAKPLVQMLALIQGIRQGIDAVMALFKKDRGGGENV